MSDKVIHPMSFPELPYYLTVKKVIDNETDTVNVVVESKIHVEKEVTLPTSYSIGYTRDRPNRFRAEVLASIVRRYGLKPDPLKYS